MSRRREIPQNRIDEYLLDLRLRRDAEIATVVARYMPAIDAMISAATVDFDWHFDQAKKRSLIRAAIVEAIRSGQRDAKKGVA